MFPTIGSGRFITAPVITEDGDPILDPLVLQEANAAKEATSAGQANGNPEDVEFSTRLFISLFLCFSSIYGYRVVGRVWCWDLIVVWPCNNRWFQWFWNGKGTWQKSNRVETLITPNRLVIYIDFTLLFIVNLQKSFSAHSFQLGKSGFEGCTTDVSYQYENTYRLCCSDSPKTLWHPCWILQKCIAFEVSDTYPATFLRVWAT